MMLAFDCQAGREPSWLTTLPKAGNETYMYVREAGEGATYNDAFNQAVARVFQSTANRIGQPFDGQKINNALQSGTTIEYISRQYNIPINKVDDYEVILKDGSHRVFVLCQVAVAGNIQPQWDIYRPEGDISNSTALFRSLIPGLGQIGKGYTGEGVVTLLGEVALVGGGLGCYFMAQDRLHTMNDYTTTYNDFDAARKSYRTLQTTSYICWGAAGALYIYNLIRSYTMKPKSFSAVVWEPSLISVPNSVAPSLSLTLSYTEIT